MWITYRENAGNKAFLMDSTIVMHRQNDDFQMDTHLSKLLFFTRIEEKTGGTRQIC